MCLIGIVLRLSSLATKAMRRVHHLAYQCSMCAIIYMYWLPVVFPVAKYRRASMIDHLTIDSASWATSMLWRHPAAGIQLLLDSSRPNADNGAGNGHTNVS